MKQISAMAVSTESPGGMKREKMRRLNEYMPARAVISVSSLIIEIFR